MSSETAENLDTYSEMNPTIHSQEGQRTDEEELSRVDDTDFEIMTYPSDFTLKGYKELWDQDRLKIPPFQRKFIWQQTRASRLIESFLLGLAVPSVFLYKEYDSAKYLVIDGQQRITSIVNFFKGIFKDKKFKLKGVHKKWEGMSLTDLNDADKFKLETTVMRATIIQQLNPKNTSGIYHIFERLNTGGVNLNPMEVRMCVSQGEFTDMLTDLNKMPQWRKLFGKPEEDVRSKDKELILRILALYDKGNEYTAPLRKFLNTYLDEHKNTQETAIYHQKAVFLKALDKAFFIKKPFRLSGNVLNISLMESVLVALMSSSLTDKTKINKAYGALLKNDKYLDSVKRSKTARQDVIDRIQIAKNIFSGHRL